MAENQTNNQLYHFSIKILFLSILFLLINAAWFGLITFQKKMEFKEVAPKLVFAIGQDVEVKSPFDDEYTKAKINQYLTTGSNIKTDDSSYAEIKLEGNVIRLDNKTELRLVENNFENSALPRFVFELIEGNAWVNAFDPIVIKIQQAKARFAHTVGVYKYSSALSNVYSVVGNVDLTLYDKDSKLLTTFIVPLKNQVTFSDSQLIPDYARLEYSKLKKELKMFKISQSILDENWIKQNTRDSVIGFLARDGYIFSPSIYQFQSRYHTWKEKLSLIPSQKRLENLYLARIKLKYLLGYVNNEGDSALANTILGEFSLLADNLKGDSSFNDMVEDEFYAIRNVKTDTPAYKTKENLRQYLFKRDNGPELFRTYLADLDYLFRVNQLKQAETLAKNWSDQWKDSVRQKNPDEFDQQARIYHSIILAYADRVTTSFLSILDDIGDYRLKHAKETEEVLFEIAMERLDVSKYLVANYRYTEAKTYLRTSYSKLNLAQQETSAAARDLFIKDATLIAERITFAEESLKGSAEAVDEQKFREYLSTQERDKSLIERFTTFLKEEEQAEEKVTVYYPKISDVSQKFTLARIIVLDEDIEADPSDPFKFEIKNARLVDRAKDGSSLTFTADYDYTTNAVYNVVLNDKTLKGNFTLEDFIQLAKTGDEEIETANVPKTEIDNLTDFINLTESEEGKRSEIVAQDLAKELLIKELDKYDVLVSDKKQVSIINQTTLAEFKLTDVFVEDTLQKRSVQVTFDYDALNKTMSNISIKDESTVTFPAKVNAADFTQTVFKNLYGKEQETKAGSDAIDELDKQGLTLLKTDFKFLDPKMNQVDFKKIKMKKLPIEFSGIYDRTTKTFIKAEHSLWKTENIGVDAYIKQLSELWVVDFLSQKGIEIGITNIETALPAEKIDIKNYVRGTKVLDFTFDVTNNRLTNISLQGTEGSIPSMTFDEFALIEK